MQVNFIDHAGPSFFVSALEYNSARLCLHKRIPAQALHGNLLALSSFLSEIRGEAAIRPTLRLGRGLQKAIHQLVAALLVLSDQVS